MLPDGEPGRAGAALYRDNSLLINSGDYSGMPCQEAIAKMSKYAEEHGFGKATVTFRLKDWGISRQRYWGTPIPMIYCPDLRHCAGAGEGLAGAAAGERGDHAGRRLAAGQVCRSSST